MLGTYFTHTHIYVQGSKYKYVTPAYIRSILFILTSHTTNSNKKRFIIYCVVMINILTSVKQ